MVISVGSWMHHFLPFLWTQQMMFGYHASRRWKAQWNYLELCFSLGAWGCCFVFLIPSHASPPPSFKGRFLNRKVAGDNHSSACTRTALQRGCSGSGLTTTGSLPEGPARVLPQQDQPGIAQPGIAQPASPRLCWKETLLLPVCLQVPVAGLARAAEALG